MPGLSGVKQIATGYNHTVFLLDDGTVKACGYNADCELGDGTTTSRSTPIVVSGLSDVKQISAGSFHTIFLKDDGTVIGCGCNNSVQLGNGTTQTKTTPVAVSISGVKQIRGGNGYTVFLMDDGTVKVCGVNNSGQLGDGTTTDKTTPVVVSGLSNVVAIPEVLIEDTTAVSSTVYLVLSSSGAAMKYGTSWVLVTADWANLTEAQKLAYFQSDGMTSVPSAEQLSSLGKFQILRYTSDSTATTATTVNTVNLTLTAVLNDKLILATSDVDVSNFSKLTQIDPVCNVAGSGVVKIILSVDSGTTWKAWNGTAWGVVQATAADVKASGMLPATVAVLTSDELVTLLGTSKKIRIGYLLSMSASTDTANADRLDIVGTQAGVWEHAIHGQDFTSRFVDNDTLQVTIKLDTSSFTDEKTDFKINHPV
ncbi:hypothetical protein Ga0466249_005153 [Sporomusaceae bacterium BoRhaA]|uniref:RCC1 domain-containing protein n=1 Tax=Pelorhabdus rhamnosifermentans TaxID=2772457 RepID=UPI001C062A5A|nr:hypothetical protein [Pelorhabdus rhamnosifermentans]MBU2704001.1 hypothetical protein [Pelorhabdus rhamnosifermentans]